MAHKVLVSTRFFDADSAAFLRDNGCEVIRTGLPDDVQDDVLDGETLTRLLTGVEGWIVGMVPVTHDLMAATLPSGSSPAVASATTRSTSRRRGRSVGR